MTLKKNTTPGTFFYFLDPLAHVFSGSECIFERKASYSVAKLFFSEISLKYGQRKHITVLEVDLKYLTGV